MYSCFCFLYNVLRSALISVKFGQRVIVCDLLLRRRLLINCLSQHQVANHVAWGAFGCAHRSPRAGVPPLVREAAASSFSKGRSSARSNSDSGTKNRAAASGVVWSPAARLARLQPARLRLRPRRLGRARPRRSMPLHLLPVARRRTGRKQHKPRTQSRIVSDGVVVRVRWSRIFWTQRTASCSTNLPGPRLRYAVPRRRLSAPSAPRTASTLALTRPKRGSPRSPKSRSAPTQRPRLR